MQGVRKCLYSREEQMQHIDRDGSGSPRTAVKIPTSGKWYLFSNARQKISQTDCTWLLQCMSPELWASPSLTHAQHRCSMLGHYLVEPNKCIEIGITWTKRKQEQMGQPYFAWVWLVGAQMHNWTRMSSSYPEKHTTITHNYTQSELIKLLLPSNWCYKQHSIYWLRTGLQPQKSISKSLRKSVLT